MVLKEISSALESLAPLAFQETWDNSGLILGEPSADISAALICLDLTREVMQEAIDRRCNLIISHHPLIFKGLKRINPSEPTGELLRGLVKNDIAVYAVHTNADNSFSGLNMFLGKKIGLENLRILREQEGMLAKLVTFVPLGHQDAVRQALFSAGAGVIGKYDCCSYNVCGNGTFRASDSANPFIGEKNTLHFEEEIRMEVIVPLYLRDAVVSALLSAHPYEEVAYDIYPVANKFPGSGAGIIGDLPVPVTAGDFLSSVKEKLDIRIIKYCGNTGKEIRKVALCGGSGGFLIPDAVRAGADVFLTADLKYHDFAGNETALLIADIGHYESEQWIKELLRNCLNEKFPKFAVFSSERNRNPVNYL